MSSDEIREILIMVLLDIQEKGGKQVPEEINEETRPIGDFEGFDSINAVEVTSELINILGYKLPINLLLGPTPDKQLTIDEMVSRIQTTISAQGGLP